VESSEADKIPDPVMPGASSESDDLLQRRSRLLGAIMEKLPIVACRIDSAGIARESFGGGLRGLGLSDGQIVGSNVFETWPALREHVRKAQAGGTAQFEFASDRSTRRVFDVNLFADPADAASVLGFAVDVTQSKGFEETLRRSRDQLEAILKAITDAVLVTDPEGWVAYANDAAAALLGMPSGREMLGASFESLASQFEIGDESGRPAEGATFPELLRARAEKGPDCGPATRVVCFRRRGSVEERWLSVNSTCILGEGGRVAFYIDTAYDITDRKKTEDALRKSEEQLRQSQKMEAMGRLAGGVAHDFNNLLTAINGYGEILAQSMDGENPLRAHVEEIRRAGERAASLTRQLLTFSRKQVLSRRVLDLNRSVSEIRLMLVRLIGEDIELITTADPELAPVNVDPGQIEQVILNLALNSRDAMPMGGKLLIETANVTLDPRQSGIFFPVDEGSYVRLTVTDTGFGMEEEVKAHLFEPFFTTKPPGQGTGLGLCTVYGIVKQAGGNVSVWSEPGRGTSISVFLPALAPGEKCGLHESAGPRLAVSTGRETVLLAEDEEVVRRLVFELLTAQGYRVLPVASGPEALELSARHEGPIDLLLTDVVMVGMSGRELAEKLLASRPRTKVLYMSGYTDDAILRHGVFQNSADFISKPFSTGALIHKIRNVLEMQESGRLAAGTAVSSASDFASPADPR
jgi:two-component system cell cycle sensor histidine kinase/response regulator CckA